MSLSLKFIQFATWEIRNNAFPNVFERGRSLAQVKRIKDVSWNQQDIRMKLQGETDVYDVRVYAHGNQLRKLRWSCTCPYAQDRTDPCKHVAALGFFMNKYDSTIKLFKNKKLAEIREDAPIATPLEELKRKTTLAARVLKREGAFTFIKESGHVPEKPEYEGTIVLELVQRNLQAEFMMEGSPNAKVLLKTDPYYFEISCTCKVEANPFCEHERNLLSLYFFSHPELSRFQSFRESFVDYAAENLPFPHWLIREKFKLAFHKGSFSLKPVLTAEQKKQFLGKLEWVMPHVTEIEAPSHFADSFPIIAWEADFTDRPRPKLACAQRYKREPQKLKSIREMDQDEIPWYGLSDLERSLTVHGVEDWEGENGVLFFRRAFFHAPSWLQIPNYYLEFGKTANVQQPIQLNFRGKLTYERKEFEGEYCVYQILLNNIPMLGSKKRTLYGDGFIHDRAAHTLWFLDPYWYGPLFNRLHESDRFAVLNQPDLLEETEKLLHSLGIFPKSRKVEIPVPVESFKLQIYLSEQDDKNLGIAIELCILLQNGKKVSDFHFHFVPVLMELFDDSEWEEIRRALMDLYALHPLLQLQCLNELIKIPITDPRLPQLLNQLSEKVEQEGWELYGQETIQKLLPKPKTASIQTRLFSAEQWFSMEVELKFEKELIGIIQLREALKEGKRFILLKDGTVGEIPEAWFKKFARYMRLADEKSGRIHRGMGHLIQVDDFNEVSAEVMDFIDGLKHKLAEDPNQKKEKLPKGVNAELRPYQLAAYQWMHDLSAMSWGGILADDMGLGKTLQAITFIQWRLEKKQGPHLIIVPKSLLHNWESEWLRFTGLKPWIHQGLSRQSTKAELAKHKLIVVSYGTLLRDEELFTQIKFDTIIFDEAQAIKNPATKTRQTAGKLSGSFKLVMTGTPIENSLIDLYSLLSLVNPGILGSQKQFQHRFNDQKPESMALLKEMIYPFMLRRLKAQVAADLPEKMVVERIIDMDEDQAEQYETMRRHYLDLFQQKTEAEWKKSAFLVLKGMNELRQICNAPSMLEGHIGLGAKIKELMYELEEIIPNHKVLIFSQYVKMLRLVEHQIKQKGWGYVQLDGKTKDRAQVVQSFQENPEVRIFLISLKAGGTGLNLTQAEYVYLLDPWWNPAAEQQAIDRAHRIGQTNKVIAYKFICKGSIEEKVLEMQRHKQHLSDSVIAEDEEFTKTLDRERILEMFGEPDKTVLPKSL